ncbi:hypothetical protein HBA55_25180 [Pseudomaricurvus alkylphenolicus]|uniref:hypothetical protein n=1 Tax=Pseudomaricurvus alkylphenolicus TaxID=1306991 RepID=UPI00142190EF|nr:hypothetical protein [Pseudomaricurvus alkylphenolicus]NIB42925.1 hypothetical protein [Pseudomaricurvus alkylphenolicus]
MADMASAQSLRELKHHYRRLAALHHPDRGGDLLSMQNINQEYEKRLQQLRMEISLDSRTRPGNTEASSDFSHLQPGDHIFVNATECEVLEVNQRYFRAVAKGRCRQAQFDIRTGVGVYNQRLRASFTPRTRPDTN